MLAVHLHCTVTFTVSYFRCLFLDWVFQVSVEKLGQNFSGNLKGLDSYNRNTEPLKHCDSLVH